MGNNGNGRQRAKAQERRLAKAVGGKRVPLSGAGETKGDVLSGRVFYECKTSARVSKAGVKSITVRKDDLLKMLDQQQQQGKELHAMQLHFAGDRRDWVVMSFEQWQELTGEGFDDVQRNDRGAGGL